MPITKERAEQVIKEGGSVMVAGDIFTTVETLPKDFSKYEAGSFPESNHQRVNEGNYTEEGQREEQSGFVSNAPVAAQGSKKSDKSETGAQAGTGNGS